MKVDGPQRESGWPKRTWMNVVKIDMKKYNLSKYLAQNRLKWKNRIHVADLNRVETRL